MYKTAARIATSFADVDKEAWLILAFMYVYVEGMYAPIAEDAGIL